MQILPCDQNISSLVISLLNLLIYTLDSARDGAVVRALAYHQCGPGSNPGVDAICGLRLLLVLYFASRGFSPDTPVFPSKTTFPNSNSTTEESGRRRTTLWMYYLQIIIYLLFIYLIKYENVKRKLMLVTTGT